MFFVIITQKCRFDCHSPFQVSVNSCSIYLLPWHWSDLCICKGYTSLDLTNRKTSFWNKSPCMKLLRWNRGHSCMGRTGVHQHLDLYDSIIFFAVHGCNIIILSTYIIKYSSDYCRNSAGLQSWRSIAIQMLGFDTNYCVKSIYIYNVLWVL